MDFAILHVRKLPLKINNLIEIEVAKMVGGPKYAGESVEVYENKRSIKLIYRMSVEVDEK